MAQPNDLSTLSDDDLLEAYLRIAAGRAARRFPAILTMLADGRLHLSGIALLAPHLTEENCAAVLLNAARRTKSQIKELITELAPRPDVAPTIRKLPSRPQPAASQLCPDKVEISAPAKPVSTAPPQQPAPPTPSVRSAPPKPEPLSPQRFKVTFTASGRFKDKLERLQALMGADLEAAIETAVTEQLERLEAKRYAETKKPRKDVARTDTSPKSRYVPAAVRRRVHERDGDQCAFVDESGRRCTECRNLEFHHDDPFGLGGHHDPETMRLLCRRHNLYLAERDYGKEVMDTYRNKVGRVSETAPTYGPWVVRQRRSSGRRER